MKLAIGWYHAFGSVLSRVGPDFYNRPSVAAPLLRWWRQQGAEGVVFYDQMPGFYDITVDQWRLIKAAVEAEGFQIAAFNVLRKSLHVPELAAIDRAKLDIIMRDCEILRPEIIDISVNVPIPAQQDDHTSATRRLYQGAYASTATWEMAATALRQLARECAAINAQLSLELHDDGLQDTAANVLRLLRLVNEPNVGANPDIGNAFRVPYEIHETWRDMMTLLAPHTNYWEVKNYRKIYVADERRYYSWNTELPDGQLDFRSGAEILWRAGFRGWVCQEGGAADGVHSSLTYLRYFRWILDEWIPFITAAYPD